MATRILVDMAFDGPTPIVTGNRWLTLLNICRVLAGLNHGSRFRTSTGISKVKVIPTIVPASATVTITQATPVTTGQTLTIAGSALTAQQSRARATLTCVSAVAGNTVVVNGVTFTGADGAVVLGEATFSVDTSDTATATSLAAQINGYASPLLSGLVTCPFTAAGVVTVCAVAEGTSGNAITLTTTGGTITATGSGFLAGGAAIANDKFDFGSGTTNVTASLNRAINASTTANIQKVTAAITSAGVITMTAVAGGVAGNAITLTSSSGTTLAVTGSGFLASGSQGAATTWVL